MDSPQSVVSPMKSSPVLEIYIHQARDIHNICIYHNQDVYAKFSFTADPGITVSTQIVNGGGKNPVFNQTIRLIVPTVNCSLKCEIWMLSRVKNYLEDQLLGFALVPLSEVIMSNGKLEREFSLSSTDLFHSPAGYVQLRLFYTGASPEVMVIPAFNNSMTANSGGCNLELPDSGHSKFDDLEFPDPKILNENQLMVSEYIQIPCTDMYSESSESLVSSDIDHKQLRLEEKEAQVVQSFSTTTGDSSQIVDSVSSDDSPSGSIPTSSLSACDTPNQEEHVSSLTEKFTEPIASVKNIESEQNLVQQDIIDMYMKSMHQFTESLAKMKLPVDIMENGSISSENSSPDKKLQTSKSSNSRVFYGSRAFF